jgi:transcription antitermination protein NusB
VTAGRRSARRQAVFALYQQDLLGITPEAALLRSPEVSSDPYTRELVLGVAEQQDRIDTLLERHLADWNLGRLGVLERSILRIAAFELLDGSEVPAAVVIDEAVGLAKRFCSDEAGSLVNGVLGSLVGAGDMFEPKEEDHTEAG